MRHDEVIPTRASLLERLKDLGDAASWDEFHRTYRELIFSVARRAGLVARRAVLLLVEGLRVEGVRGCSNAGQNRQGDKRRYDCLHDLSP